jgi:ferric-dicitrate binding protein FerR (iron transport regulator)
MINHKKRNKAYLIGIGIVTLFLLLLFSFKLGWLSNQTVEQTAAQQKREIQLPDGSFANLNAGSKISFNADNFAEKRIVTLEGEALFVVKRGQPFLVKTKYGYARSTSNQFNVYARPDDFEVTCFLGQVEAIHSEERILLSMNETAIWKNNTFVKSPYYSERPDWMIGETIFKEESFQKAIGELERLYNLKVVLETTGNPPFTGNMPHNELQTAVDNLVDPYGYRYEQNGRILRIWEP